MRKHIDVDGLGSVDDCPQSFHASADAPPGDPSDANSLLLLINQLVEIEVVKLRNNEQDRLCLVNLAREEGILGVDDSIINNFVSLSEDRQNRLAKLSLLNRIAPPWFRDPMIAFQERIEKGLDLEECFDMQYQWPYKVKVDLNGYTPISKILRTLKAKFDKFFKRLVQQIAAKYNCYLVLEDGGDAFIFSFNDPDQGCLFMMEMKNLDLLSYLETEYVNTLDEDYKEMVRLIKQVPKLLERQSKQKEAGNDEPLTTFRCSMLKFQSAHLRQRHIDSPSIKQSMPCAAGSIFEKASTMFSDYAGEAQALMPGNVYDEIQMKDKAEYFQLAVLAQNPSQEKVVFMSEADFESAQLQDPKPSRARVYERFDGDQLVDVLLVTEARALRLGIDWSKGEVEETVVGDQRYKPTTAYRYYLAKKCRSGPYASVKKDDFEFRPRHALRGKNVLEMPTDHLDKLLMGTAKMLPRGTLSRVDKKETASFPLQLVCCLQHCSLDQLPGDSSRFDQAMIELQERLQALGKGILAPVFKKDENKMDITMRLGNANLDAALQIIKNVVDQLKRRDFEAVAGIDVGPCETGGVSGEAIIRANRAMTRAKEDGYSMMIHSRAIGPGRLSSSKLTDVGKKDIKGYLELQRMFVFGEAMKQPIFVGMPNVVTRIDVKLCTFGQADQPGTAFIQGSGGNALLDYAEGCLRHQQKVEVIAYDPLSDRQNGQGFFDRVVSGIAEINRANVPSEAGVSEATRSDTAPLLSQEVSLSVALGTYTGEKPIVVAVKNVDSIPSDVLTVVTKMTQSFPGRFSLVGSFGEGGALADLAPEQTISTENLSLDDAVARILYRHYHVAAADGQAVANLLRQKHEAEAREIKTRILDHPLYAKYKDTMLPFDVAEQFVAMAKKTPSGKWEFDISETREVIGEAAQVLAVCSLMHGEFGVADLRSVANGFLRQDMLDEVIERYLNSFVAQEESGLQLNPFLTKSENNFQCLGSTLRNSDHYVEPYPTHQDQLISKAYFNHVQRFGLNVDNLQVDESNFEHYRQAFNLLERMEVRNGREDDLKKIAIALESYAARTGKVLRMREELYAIGELLQPSESSTESDKVTFVHNRMHYAESMILSGELDVADNIFENAIAVAASFDEIHDENLKLAVVDALFKLANVRRMKRETLIVAKADNAHVTLATNQYNTAKQNFVSKCPQLIIQNPLSRVQSSMLTLYDLYTNLEARLEEVKRMQAEDQDNTQALCAIQSTLDETVVALDAQKAQLDSAVTVSSSETASELQFEFKKNLALAKRMWLLALRTYIVLKKSFQETVTEKIEEFYTEGLKLEKIYETEVQDPAEEIFLLEALITPFFDPSACFSGDVPDRFTDIQMLATCYKSILDREGDNLDLRLRINAYMAIGETFRFVAQEQKTNGQNETAQAEYKKAIQAYKENMRWVAIPGQANQQYIILTAINILNCAYHLAELDCEDYLATAERDFTQQLNRLMLVMTGENKMDRIATWTRSIFQVEGCAFGKQKLEQLFSRIAQ